MKNKERFEAYFGKLPEFEFKKPKEKKKKKPKKITFELKPRKFSPGF